MKRDPLQDYRALLANLYGPKPRPASKQQSKRTVVAMSFDDGRPVRVARVPGRGIEYAASAPEAADEYDVAADNPRFDPLAYQASRDEVCTCGSLDGEEPPPDARPSAARAAPPAGEPEVVRAEARGPAEVPRNGASAFTQRRVRELVADKELLADMQAILEKKPEAVSPPKELEPTRRPDPRPEAPPRPQEPTEHAIFDRIAKNMQYATAYDLGSVELSHRFDAFDQSEPRSTLRAPTTL